MHMAPDGRDKPQGVAIDQLESLGLSAYAARTFVALTGIGEGTARDVSEAADVPRTRVYDAVEELQERGLVDVQHSSPKRFWPVSAGTARRHFRQQNAHRLETLEDSLEMVQTPPDIEDRRGVWTVVGQQTITDRVVDFIQTAGEEVVFMTTGDLLADEIVAALEAASDRGVPVKLAEMSNDVETELAASVPAAESFESLWNWNQTPAGRLLMVDRERTLVSVLTENGDDLNDDRDETAIWGVGQGNGLVVVLRAMFAWQLDESEDTL